MSYVYTRTYLSEEFFSKSSPVECKDRNGRSWTANWENKEEPGIKIVGFISPDAYEPEIVRFHPGNTEEGDESSPISNGYFVNYNLSKVHKKLGMGYTITHIWPVSGADAPDSRAYRCTLDRIKSSQYFRPFSCAGVW